jgi:hypothetical protein
MRAPLDVSPGTAAAAAAVGALDGLAHCGLFLQLLLG